MPVVVGIAFKPVTKIYYFDPTGLDDLQAGESVVVETARGRTLGRVVLTARDVPESDISGTLKPVVRRATAWDQVQSDQMAHREPDALKTCRQRATALGMTIKIVNVEFSFDASSAVVYFTSEQRVDFRNLVHDLSQVLHARVEMRQVGVRDEAKFQGGFGRCGRELCCATWLREFAPVSIKMAKTQDLPLNAPEVSGVCGRLLCCLAYENDFYIEARKQMPRVNTMVDTPDGPGKVRQVHVLVNSIRVQVDGPNDTRTMIDLPVPEPEFSLSPKSQSPTGAPRRFTSDPQEIMPDSENAGSSAGPVEAEGADEPPSGVGGATKPRARRKKR